MADLMEIPWRACDLGEGGWDRETPFCVEPCSGCYVLALAERGKLDPFDVAGHAEWDELLALVGPRSDG